MEDDLSMSQIGLKKHYEARQKERSPVERGVMARAFKEACQEKFERRAKENNRSLEPWVDKSREFLCRRLLEEVNELFDAIAENPVDVMGECLDVANFAWFIYEQAKAQTKTGA